jgi:hypothetical protein
MLRAITVRTGTVTVTLRAVAVGAGLVAVT